MRYLIVGCGRVGSTLAKLLVADKHDVVVVDENPAAFKRLGNRFGGQVEVGTGIDYDVLKRAGAERADGFVAVTDGDNRNVMAALIAQRMFRIPKIVARIYDPPRGQLYRELGIETFSPTTIGAQIIRDRLPGRRLRQRCRRSTSASSRRWSRPSRRRKPASAWPTSRSTARSASPRSGASAASASPRRPTCSTEGDEINAIVAPEALSQFAAAFAQRATRSAR